MEEVSDCYFTGLLAYHSSSLLNGPLAVCGSQGACQLVFVSPSAPQAARSIAGLQLLLTWANKDRIPPSTSSVHLAGISPVMHQPGAARAASCGAHSPRLPCMIPPACLYCTILHTSPSCGLIHTGVDVVSGGGKPQWPARNLGSACGCALPHTAPACRPPLH
jgi:hypothetical protein